MKSHTHPEQHVQLAALDFEIDAPQHLSLPQLQNEAGCNDGETIRGTDNAGILGMHGRAAAA